MGEKYPFVRQITNCDCGAACVSMVLKKLINASLSLGQIKHIIYADDNGSSLMGIKTGLKELGISSTVFECELSKEAFEEMDFPVITQIRIEKEIHFVVLYGIKNNKLILADPLKRKIIRKKVDTFINGWIPFILSVNDIALNHKYYEMEKCVIGKWEIYKIISAQKGKIIISWLVSILIYITGILLTGMYSAFFDVIIPNKYIGIITSVLIGYSQFLIINFFLSYINSILSVKINNKIDELLTKKLLDSFFDKDFSVIEGFKSGELITRFRNISSIRSIYLYFIQAFPIDILGILFIYYILHRQNNELSVLLFVPLIIFVGVIYLSHEKMKEDSSLLFDKEEQFNSSLIEAITNIETLKNYQITDAFEKKIEENLKSLFKIMQKFFTFNVLQTNLKNLVVAFFNLYVLGLGAYLVINDNLASGSLLVFNSLAMQVFSPFLKITNMQAAYEQGEIARLRYVDILNTNIPRNWGGAVINDIKELTLDNVSYKYSVDSLILEKANLNIKSKQNIALIGESGSGKTTIAKLIANYYEVNEGSIRINNEDIKKYTKESIRSQILYVPQQIEIFSGTIMDNILLGRKIEEKKVFEIAVKLGFDTVIDKLPMGYNTMIGEKGINLSLGQMQILNIIRATINDYQIIIFDEITNGLDFSLKEKVCNYLFHYGNIKIFITHDLEFAKKCDDFYLVKNKVLLHDNSVMYNDKNF